MKIAFVVLSILATLAVSVDPNVEYMKKQIIAQQICKRKTGFKDVDHRSIIKGDSKTRTAQCFLACTFKEMGTMTDNKLNMTQVKTLLANYRKADPKKYELVIKVHEACTKETDKDECVAIIKIMNCIEQENNKANKANQTNKNGTSRKA